MQICVSVWRIGHFVNKCVIKIIDTSADPVACLCDIRGKLIGQLASEIFKFENVDDGRRRTDDAFGSGELIKLSKINTSNAWANKLRIK